MAISWDIFTTTVPVWSQSFIGSTSTLSRNAAASGSALLGELHERLALGTSYILMVIAGNEPAVNFYRRHGFVEQARVDGPSYIREHQGVDLPSNRRDVPALILRFTKRES